MEIGNILTNIDLQRLLINELRNYQSTLLGKVPTAEYNKVDNFLTKMSRDINSYLPNRQPSSPPQPPQPQTADAQPQAPHMAPHTRALAIHKGTGTT